MPLTLTFGENVSPTSEALPDSSIYSAVYAVTVGVAVLKSVNSAAGTA